VVGYYSLSGGNDGLNTVILYAMIFITGAARLGIDKTHAAMITDEGSLHPALSGLKGLYDDGSLGILNSVGYPNPTDPISGAWISGRRPRDRQDIFRRDGWALLDAQCSGCDHPTQALEIDDVVTCLKGDKIRGWPKDPRRLTRISNDRYFRTYWRPFPARRSRRQADQRVLWGE